MVFNSFQFLWLFPVIWVGYYVVTSVPGIGERTRHKVANLSLLAVSYGLYMQWRPAYALLLLGVTAVTYTAAILVDGGGKNRRKYLIAAGVVLALLPLLVFKYYNFLNDSVGSLLSAVGISYGLRGLNWALPIGLSFFTFQAVGYLFDVYYRRLSAERNWWDYMLFVAFFPQILAGPINKAKDLLPQIKASRHFDYSQAVAGLKFLLWGMFLKVVMADRLALFVNSVFDDWQYNSGVSCLLASVLYSLQIYGDFAGYSLMAVGVGRLLGFEMINNFRRPYFSVSVTDFWHRWHISLSTWLKDYVYIPLGGSRCSRVRNYWNIIVTFFVSGFWHGANWTFIVWGLLHGVFQVVEKALGLQKCESQRLLVRLPRIVLTFVVITFLWTLFRMPTLADGIGVIVHMFTAGGRLMEIFDMGNHQNALFTILSAGTVIISECVEEFAPHRFALLNNRRRGIRWATYVVLAASIVMCGVLDSSQFIYVIF